MTVCGRIMISFPQALVNWTLGKASLLLLISRLYDVNASRQMVAEIGFVLVDGRTFICSLNADLVHDQT